MTTQPTNSIDSIRIPVKCTHCGAIDYLELPKPTKAQLLAEILKALPNKWYPTSDPEHLVHIKAEGYNEALDKVAAIFKKLFKEIE